MFSLKQHITLLILTVFWSISYSQKSSSLDFILNKGQEDKSVLYKVNTNGGRVFIQSNSFYYDFIDQQDLHEISEELHHSIKPDKDLSKATIDRFAYKVNFLNSNTISFNGVDKKLQYHNYFLGNDESKWASKVPVFNKIEGKNLYQDIDLIVYSSNSNFKYDFVVQPNGNPDLIKLQYEGVSKLTLNDGNLIIPISFDKVIEQAPFVYQIINGIKTIVKSKYRLEGNSISFEIGNYDKNLKLFIDPIVIASTYSGSTSTIYGHTATYDQNGNIYSAGAGFAPGGLPVTTGAYQTVYGGSRDMCINKLNPTGSALLYATYLGGSSNDYPHSLIDEGGKLYVLGSSESTNFPTTTTAFDRTHNGFSDIVVTVFNTTGTAIVGSTYLGGSGDDGQNAIFSNYGDTFKGEIITDNSGNCYVASFSESTNFPTSTGCYQSARGGLQDGVAFKLNPTLSSLTYSTYIGGSSNDAAYGVKVLGNKVYITGTAGNSFFTSSGAYTTNTGVQDGFIIAFNATATTAVYSTYFGSTSNDQSFFIDSDAFGDIYILGQSAGTISATTGKFSAGGSGTFIAKFNDSLTSHIFTSTTGDFAPVAFLVDECDNIYASGHGGLSSLTGFVITPNANQTASAGFYIMVLYPNADSIFYGSYYGTSGSHVDGGTSRFDKRGVIYQATCSNTGFPTNTTAYSTVSGSGGYDVTVFKIDLEAGIATARGNPLPSDTGCAPFNVNFTNTSKGNRFYWDFGDGSPIDSTKTPSHSFINPGVYSVRLIATDTTSTCSTPDTIFITITALSDSAISISPDTSICPNSAAQLRAIGGDTYLWSPAIGLSNQNIANPLASPNTTTAYTVISTSKCLIDTAYVTVTLYTTPTTISKDSLICLGDSVALLSTGGVSYSWSPAAGLSNSSIANPIATPTVTTKYKVDVTTSDGCVKTDSVTISVQQGLPLPITSNDTIICGGNPVSLAASGGVSYLWRGSLLTGGSANQTINILPVISEYFYVDVTNICGTITDSVLITIQKPTASTSADQSICFYDSAFLSAAGGVSYSWSPTNNITTSNLSTTQFNPGTTSTLRVIVTDNLGCKDTAFSTITVFPIPMIDAGSPQTIEIGKGITLSPTYSPGVVSWYNDPTLNCFNCVRPFASPQITTTYYSMLIDANGCQVTDSVLITVKGINAFIPSSFTPNDDGINDIFNVNIAGDDISSYRFQIFNRWGELLFKTNDMTQGWDGKHNGKTVQIGTYIWNIQWIDFQGSKQKTGHVDVIN